MKKPKEKTPLEKLYEEFHKTHYINIGPVYECEFGDHTYISCACGWKSEYGGDADITYHILAAVLEITSHECAKDIPRPELPPPDLALMDVLTEGCDPDRPVRCR